MTDNISPRYQLRVKQRRRVVEFAEDYGFRAAARHFGLARRTVRTWCRRWKADGEQGLVPRYPARRRRRVSEGIVELARVARTEYRWGATRTRIWLDRVHHIRVNAKTIQRVFCDLGLPALTKTPRRKPKQLKLFEKEAPGDSVQVDVKVVKGSASASSSTRRSMTARGCGSSDCIADKISTRASTFSRKSAARCPFRSRSCNATTALNFRSRSSWRWKRRASSTGTSSPDGRSRMGKWSAVTGLTARSSGTVTTSRRSPPPNCPWRDGSGSTTTTGFQWRCGAAHRSRNCAPCSPTSTFLKFT